MSSRVQAIAVIAAAVVVAAVIGVYALVVQPQRNAAAAVSAQPAAVTPTPSLAATAPAIPAPVGSPSPAEETAGPQCAAVLDLEKRVVARRQGIPIGSPMVAFLGDSYAEGQHLADPFTAFPYATAKALGMAPFVEARGGSGFVATGPCADSTFLDRLKPVLDAKPAVVVVEGGLNDIGTVGIANAQATLYEAVHYYLPKAKLVVVGPPNVPKLDPARVAEVADTMLRVAKENGATFVDLRDLNLTYLPDQIHADAAGHAAIAKAVAAAARQAG